MSDPMSPPDQGSGLPVAYRNEKFLSSRDARSIRILAEYLHPLSHFRQERIHDTVVFFGSARIQEDGPMARYYSEARELARLVTEWSLLLDQDRQRFVVLTGGGARFSFAARVQYSRAGSLILHPAAARNGGAAGTTSARALPRGSVSLIAQHAR